MADEPKIKIKPEEGGAAGSESARPAAAPAEASGPAPQQARQAIELDDSQAVASYCNFCRVTGTPEEVILDFGLNPQPFGMPTQPVKVAQRLVMNFFTAKRLLAALQMTIQRHEGTFGVLETDVNKRVRPGAR